MTKFPNQTFFLAACLLLLCGRMHAQEWRSVDDSTLTERERVQRTDYAVRVRAPRGTWRPVRVVGALVSDFRRRGKDGNNGSNGTDTLGTKRLLMGVAMFTDGFDAESSHGGEVEVEVQRQGAPFRKVEIRPTAFGIRAHRVDGQTVRFRLRPEQKVSVEFDGDRHHNLFVFPDRPVPRPASGDSLIYFGPGEHEVGSIVLRSGQTLFIDEGATVYGRIEARNANHVRIVGRGILCGSCNVHNFRLRQSLIYMRGCTDVEIEGVFFRGSPSWTLCFAECERLRLENVKQVCWMRNSDGIDICNSSRVEIRNCFLRNYDDNISLKNIHLISGKTTAHVSMTDCTLWADCAHNLLVGPETKETLAMGDILFDNIQILEARETAWPWRGAMAVMGSDEGTFRRVTFRNIWLDHTSGGQMFAVEICPYNTSGRSVQDVRFENIHFSGDARRLPPSTVKGLDASRRVENVVLQHVCVNGRRLSERNLSRYVETNEYVSGLRVEKKRRTKR